MRPANRHFFGIGEFTVEPNCANERRIEIAHHGIPPKGSPKMAREKKQYSAYGKTTASIGPVARISSTVCLNDLHDAMSFRTSCQNVGCTSWRLAASCIK